MPSSIKQAVLTVEVVCSGGRLAASRTAIALGAVIPTKACPIVLRGPTASKIMVFRHPSAGIQLVKGTIEPGERPADAALRELREESGIANAAVYRDLGLWDAQYQGQIWSFQLCTTPQELPESWNHLCGDDGDLDLHFFWHDLNCEPSEHWHPLFRRALEFVRSSVRGASGSTPLLQI